MRLHRMSTASAVFHLVVTSTVCWLAQGDVAFAYVDPTAAGSLLQALYLVVASVLVGIGLIPGRLRAWVRRLRTRQMRSEEGQESSSREPD